MLVGVDFCAPRRACGQRRKIIAIVVQAAGWHSYRVDATRLNERFLASERPGWTVKELADGLVKRSARAVGVDFSFCVPHALLHDPKFVADVGYKGGAFIGWHTFNWWIAQHLKLADDSLDFTPFALWTV